MKILTFLRCAMSNGEETNYTIAQLTRKKEERGRKESHNH